MKQYLQIICISLMCLFFCAACNSCNTNASLVEAVETDNEKLVKCLIKNGKSPLTFQEREGVELPFEAACFHGNPSIMKMFLKTSGTSIPPTDITTCIRIASEEGHNKIVKLLLQEQKRRKLSTDSYIALISATTRGHIEIVKYIVTKYDNSKSTLGNALIVAADNGNKEIVDILINAGADINTKTQNDSTALIIASKKGYAEIVEKLLQAGADIEHRDNQGLPALAYAANNGDSEIVKIFLQTDKISDTWLQATLATAILNKNDELVKILLTKEINLNTPDVQFTPLTMACENGTEEIVKMLIQARADVNLRRKDGKTPLQIAKEKSFTQIESMLLQAGAK